MFGSSDAADGAYIVVMALLVYLLWVTFGRPWKQRRWPADDDDEDEDDDD